jgi:iron complex transport system substrate-binding protein
MKSFSRRSGVLLCLLLASVIVLPVLYPSATLATSYPLTVTDDFGAEVTIGEAPNSIVSLAPSNTEILFALDLSSKVVGVTSFCDYPPAALEKESIGGPSGESVDVERVVALDPDLILAADINGEDVVMTLRSYGLTVFAIQSTDMDDLLDDIDQVGRIANAEAQASALTSEMQERIDAVTAKTAELSSSEKPGVFHICYHNPIWTAGDNTFINDVIVNAGGTNIFADITGYQSVDIESLIARDPEVIIVTAMGGTSSGTWEWVNTEPRLATITALERGRVYYVESNWLERPGPRIVDGLEQVARSVQPSLFFVPWDYDLDDSGVISKSEAIKSVQDYFNGLIAKAQTIQVVMLYFG